MTRRPRLGADTPEIAADVDARHRAAVLDDAITKLLNVPPPPGYGGRPPNPKEQTEDEIQPE